MPNRYYLDFCPPNNRVFIHNPPAVPKGKIVELSEDQYIQLKKVPASYWEIKDNKVVTKVVTFKIRKNKDKIKQAALFVLGLVIGVCVTLLVGK